MNRILALDGVPDTLNSIRVVWVVGEGFGFGLVRGVVGVGEGEVGE